MIAEGTYSAKVTGPLFYTDTKSGGQQVVAQFIIIEGEYKGQSIDWRGSLNAGKAIEITTSALQAMRYNGSDDDSVVDHVVQIVIQNETYNNKTEARVRFVNDPNGRGRYTESDAATTAAGKARLKAAMLQAQAAKPAAKKTEEEPF